MSLKSIYKYNCISQEISMAENNLLPHIYLKTVFAELQSKINFLARNKILIHSKNI
jgi:hypothetical protein